MRGSLERPLCSASILAFAISEIMRAILAIVEHELNETPNAP